MTEIFVLPKNQASNAYSLIKDQVKRDSPLNLGLIFDKYVNKFVTGYADNQNWIEGKQSEIKRQIYMLRKERIKALEKLQEIRRIKGGNRVRYKEKGRIVQKQINEVLRSVIRYLKRCDVDNAIDELGNIAKSIQDRNTLNELRSILDNLSKIDLGMSSQIIDYNLYQSSYKRTESILQGLSNIGYKIREKELKLNWRLIINLGAASVYETSLLFHRNYSIPYIPGSAVKGVTRHWAIQKFAEEFQNQRKMPYEEAIEKVDRSLENRENLGIKVNRITFEEVIKIFGTQKQKGEVIFFDALPIIEQNKDIITLDVMNVHYRDYYQDKSGKTPPGDWMNPNPIFFLAVEKGTKFRFCVASKSQELAEKAMELLKEAVKNIGIGAKTSAGYGYFEV